MPTRDVIAAGVFALLGAFVGASSSAWVGYFGAQRTLDAKLVEIGVGILSVDPSKTDVSPARGWAIRLVERHSGVDFSEADRALLLHNPIGTNCRADSTNWTADSTGPCRASSAR